MLNKLLPRPIIFQRKRLAVLLGHLDDDAFDFRVGLEAIFAQLAADTRHFEASERRLRFQNVVTIDPDRHITKKKDEKSLLRTLG